MTEASPTKVTVYLAELKTALSGAPTALIRDALADAEEFLRSEIAQSSGKTEAEVLAWAIENYGMPTEIAEEYRAMETTITGPFPQSGSDDERKSLWGLGVILDPTAYGALLYMLLSLATGVFYFTWTITGLSLLPLMLILVIAIPLAVVFIGSVRVLALIEGRVVEGLLGVRMPRRLPADASGGLGFWGRIKAMLTDARTWTSMLYLLLMLPLGTLYFSIAVTLLALSVGLAGGGIYELVSGDRGVQITEWPAGEHFFNSVPGLMLVIFAGIALLFVTLNVAKAVGLVHGRIAEALLAKI
jgi:uncharacterized membrane protein